MFLDPMKVNLLRIYLIAIFWPLPRSGRITEWILIGFSGVSTTVWLYHFDTNETHEEKAWKELRKNAPCCFEQILEEAAYKTATYLPSHKPSK